MSDAPTQAELTLADPDEELETDREAIRSVSAANNSEASKLRDFEDGSVILLRCRMGGEVDVRAFASPDEAAAPLPPLSDPE